MKMKKVIAAMLAVLMVGSLAFTGCGKKDTSVADTKDKTEDTKSDTSDSQDTEKKEIPTITFTHGYYHDESEWAVAGEMRKIYQEFAEIHKDEFNFVIKADESGAEGIYNTALNDIGTGSFYDIADFGGWDIVPVASSSDMILDLKPYLDEDEAFRNGVGVCYDQNLTESGKIYSVREQIEGVGFWYNEKLFQQAGADTPDKWLTWADFDQAVDKLTAAKITPFGLNPGWPSNILAAAYSQREEASRTFYERGKSVTDFNTTEFKEMINFMQKNVLQKIDAANFGTGGDDDEQYRTDFFDGNTAMLFNGVWDAGGSIGCKAGAENIKPAVFPTNESGRKTALLSGGTGFVVSNKLDEVQTKACVDFIKYMTSPEIASRIVEKGVGMAPSNAIKYDEIYDKVTTEDAKLLVSACSLLQKVDYPALGFGNTFGDIEGEFASKYAGLKDGSKTADSVVKELNNFMEAAE